MFERVALLVLACAFTAAPVPAQNLDSLRARARSLAASLDSVRRLSDAWQHQQSAAAQAARAVQLDTAQVGAVRIIAERGELPRARQAFEQAWQDLTSIAGGAAAGLEVQTVLVSVRRERAVFNSPELRSYRRVYLDPARGWSRQQDPARRVMAQMLDARVRGATRSFVSGDYLRGSTDWRRVYEALATSMARPARACLAGDEHACAEALGLTSEPRTWESWYSPAELGALVTSPAAPPSPERSVCSSGDVAACVSLLRTVRGAPQPLSQQARLALVHLALARGGQGAFDRLVADTSSTAPQALAHTAGVPPEELVREWRKRALAARGHTHAGLGTGVAATLFWSLVLFLFAARSTRCRLG